MGFAELVQLILALAELVSVHIVGGAKYFSAHFGSCNVFSLGLAEFLSAYFVSHMFFSLFWVSQSFLALILRVAEFFGDNKMLWISD